VPAGSAAVTVNGTSRPLDGTDPATTVLDLVRGLGLTGAKEGCAEGECGACAVLVLREDGDAARWTAVNACLLPAASLDGQEVVTAEGLGSPGSLHPVQHELAVRGASQCGYCTPGFVCSLAAEYYRPGRDGADLEAVAGNLCRCTGYRPVRDVALALTEPGAEDPLAARTTRPAPPARATRVAADGRVFDRPTDLRTALHTLADDEDAVVVAGSTDWGVEVNLRGARARHVVAVDRLPELRQVLHGADVLELGAALNLTEVEHAVAGRVPLLERLLPAFGSRLVRNSATIGGNLATASPVGDLAPGLLALEARVVLVSVRGEREVPVDAFSTGYRTTVLARDELVRSIRVPLRPGRVAAFHKVARRRLDDISAVAVAFDLDVEDGRVRTARIGLGGVAATPLRARATEESLEGRPWDARTVEQAAQVLGAEGTPLDDLRASAAYRRAMLASSLRALFASTQGAPA